MIYRIFKRGGEYFIGRERTPLAFDSYLMPYAERLTNRDRKYQEQYIGYITKGPGTYGIFEVNNHKKNKLGQCLYIGQSFNVKQRVNFHKNQIIGIRLCEKKYSPIHTDAKYFFMANKKLRFVRLSRFNSSCWNNLSLEEQHSLLTFYEQLAIDVFKPKYNIQKASPTNYLEEC